MKKLLTLALALVLAMGSLVLVACGGKDGTTSGEGMTKDDFIAELSRREAATFANPNLHYATVDCKLVIYEGDAEYDGTYEQTCDIHYGTDQYEKDSAYTSVKKGSGNNTKWQQQRLFCADYFSSMFTQMPADLIAIFKFEKNVDNLRLLADAEYNGVKLYMEYKFDANGYLTYRKESQSSGNGGESIEFTVKAYNKTKNLEIDGFLTYLHGLEVDSYNNLRYATVSATDIEQIGTNPRTTDTGDFKLKYSLDGNDNLIAEAEIRDGDGHLESTITVLGLSGLMSQHVEEYPNGEYAVKKVGSNYDVTAEIDSGNGHISVHYVFDKDGYMVYGLIRQGDEYMTEFAATAYNKAATANSLAGKTFTITSVDEYDEYPNYQAGFDCYIGSTFTFKTNGEWEWTVANMMGMGQAVAAGEYTQNGDSATYTQFSITQSGNTNSVPEQERPTHDIIISGDNLYISSWIGSFENHITIHLRATLNK